MNAELHHACFETADDEALKKLLMHCGFRGHGIAYTPQSAFIFRIAAELGRPRLYGLLGREQGQLSAAGPSSDLNIAGIFELRAFDEKKELRWRRKGKGGVATLLSDDDLTTFRGVRGAQDRSRLSLETDPVEISYLLWGVEAAGKPNDNWTTRAEAQIGSIRLPKIDGRTPRYLVAKEYRRRGEHGNVGVIAQRLSHFEVDPA